MVFLLAVGLLTAEPARRCLRRHRGAYGSWVRVCPEAPAQLRVRTEVRGHLGWHDVVVRTTVLIVDDHADFRLLARQVLQAEGFDVVGEAWDGPSALDASRRLQP